MTLLQTIVFGFLLGLGIGYFIYLLGTVIFDNPLFRVDQWWSGMVIAWNAVKFVPWWIGKGVFFGIRGWVKWCLQPEFVTRSRHGR